MRARTGRDVICWGWRMPEPLRVLTLAPDLNFGGGENRILNLARAIDPRCIDLTVATLYSRHPALETNSGSLHGEFAAIGIRIIDLGLPRPRERSRFRPLQLAHTAMTLVRAAVLLRRRILACRADVVDAHMDGTLLLAVAAAVLARVPVIATLYHVNTVPPNRRLLPLRLLALRCVAAIITDSRARADDFAAALPRFRKPIHVIPNGVRLPPPSRSREEIFAELGIPNNVRTVVGQVSGLVPIKGHDVLLRAAVRVLAVRPDVHILCAGFTRGAEAHVAGLRRQAVESGIADRVHIASYDGSIADVWSIIDVHVHASVFDSLPNAILEGMSLAKPAVVTAVGGIPDAVEDGRTGLVVPPGDAGSLAEALLLLLSDPALAARLGAAAQMRYRNRYTPERCARSVEQCLLAAAERSVIPYGTTA